MYKIICDFCGTENLFSVKERAPAECSNQACQNSLEGLEIIEFTEEDNSKIEDLDIIGLKLIYQKTSEEIIIKSDSKIILGRENYGSEVLGKIAQISRSHCSLEFNDNKFWVKDLGSTNGTFIGLGADRTSCEVEQVLKDKDFLVLGKEVFFVQLLIQEQKANPEDITQKEITEIAATKEILCTECSCVLTNLPCSCPECGTWNE
jgi:hypothetical protein